jgi:micrococcal nuclease
LVERGLACVLIIPPNGQDHREELERLEARARAGMIGMWGSCEEVPCG